MIKRLAIVVVVLLTVAGSASEGAISARLDSLRVKAFRQCYMADAGTAQVPAAFGNDAVNMAITWVCANAPAIERFDTVWVSSSIVGPALNSDFNRVALAELIWTDTTSEGVYGTIRVPLYPLSDDSVRFYLPSKPDVQPPDPKDPMTWKYYRTFAGRFLLWPVWQRQDSAQVLVHYYANDSLLQANASQTSVRQKFLDAVVDYAAYKISRRRNNLDDALMFYNAARSYLGMPPVTKEDLLEK
ncbi:MAG: hypothetical protein AB1664_00730 [Thermodesulfobacteriota bacterium]